MHIKNKLTSRKGQKMKEKASYVRKVFWGLLFIAGAALIVAGSMGYLEEFGFWTVIGSIVLVGVLVEGILHRSFGVILFSVAFFLLLNDQWMGFEDLPFWPVITAALLGSIGLSIIFPHKKTWKNWSESHGFSHHVGSNQAHCELGGDGENVHCEVCFSEGVKYIKSQEINSLSTECSFGSMIVYFDDTALKNGTAQVHTETSFGSTVMNVPSTWKVELNIESAFGGCNEKGHCNPDGQNVLYVHGEVSFGSLQIRYI